MRFCSVSEVGPERVEDDVNRTAAGFLPDSSLNVDLGEAFVSHLSGCETAGCSLA